MLKTSDRRELFFPPLTALAVHDIPTKKDGKINGTVL